MGRPKINVGDLVLYKGGLFHINGVRNAETEQDFEYYGFDDIYQIGETSATADELRKADWRDITRITKGGAPK